MSKLPAQRGRLALGVGDRIALALTAVLLSGCGSSAAPSSAVTGLSLAVHSAEWEVDRNLVVVGENASAEIETVTDDGCPTEVPCPISVDVELRSSDPAVLSPLQQRVRTPANVALIAHAPGTATVTVTTGGRTESKRVDVVAEPLPLDAIQVILVTEWNDLPVQYDASHNLTWVEIPTGQYAAFEVVALRSGTEVFGVPVYVSPYASYPPVTEATVGCRPTRVDIQCEVFHDIWIYGMTPGDDQITVWGRSNCATGDPEPCAFPSTSFTAHVIENQ
jgi:hypothetical protein